MPTAAVNREAIGQMNPLAGGPCWYPFVMLPIRSLRCVLLTLLLAAPVFGQLGDMAALGKSLPKQGGKTVLAGLFDRVTVSFDDRGIPTIEASSRDDATRALGYLHGQNRFFQMDLARRMAAGRLAEMVGSAALGIDRSNRRFQFTMVADAIVAGLDDARRSDLEVYCAGVNAGWRALGDKPPEYTVLAGDLEEWKPRDCVLVLLSLFQVLNFDYVAERPRGVALEALPPELFAFLSAKSGRFESPLLQSSPDAPLPPIPGPEVIDLRDRHARAPSGLIVDEPLAIGSNNWAVSGAHTDDGHALLANDPHLPMTAPGVWYRAQMEVGDLHLVGLTLPGNPGVIIGSNGHLAWGMTNTSADFQDLIVIEVDPRRPSRYRVPGGWEKFTTVRETIQVQGQKPVVETLKMTRWGPVFDTDWHGRPLVMKWVALEPSMVNLNILKMPDAHTIEEGIEVARSWYGPSQNVLLASADGRIAWVVSGYLPKRKGFDGSVPVSWADPGVGWDGALDESLRPVIIDPADGFLFTANNRTVDTAWASILGSSWAGPERAFRINELLHQAEGPIDEGDLLDMQLDTRLELLDFYRDLIVEVAEGAAPASPRERAGRAMSAWNGHATVGETAVILLTRYRYALSDAVLGPMVESCFKLDRRFRYGGGFVEEPVRRLLDARPAHLCPPGDADWSAMLGRVLDEVLVRLDREYPQSDLAPSWGEVNRVNVKHPLSQGAPELGPLLDMPDETLPGHTSAVRVASRTFGASARLVVGPGREERGLLHTPAGQSGHPLSPYYRAGHDDWVNGRPVPLLARQRMSRLVLLPGRDAGT